MLKRSALGPQRKTNALIWLLAFICAFIATLIIVAGLIVFVGFLAIRPKVPHMYVHSARLDNFIYNQADGILAVRLFLTVKAENHNRKAHVTLYNTKLILGYHGLDIAELVANTFEIKKNSTLELSYVVVSSSIPLGKEERYLTEQSLARTKIIPFFVKGTSRARWKVSRLGSVKFWLHINCRLYLPMSDIVVYPHCSTTSH